MNKQEALEHFIENYVKEKSVQKIQQLHEYYQTNRDELASGLIESFRRFCRKINRMQQQNQKGPVYYITFTLLRSNLIRGYYEYAVEAFNDEWFYDSQECSDVYDVSWAYQFWEQFEIELEEKRKLYLDKIVKPELEKLKLKEVNAYHEVITELVRYAMPEAIQLTEYQQIVKAEIIEIRVEDYRKTSEVVYREDFRNRDAGEIKSWLEEKDGSYREAVLCNLNLSYGDYQGIALIRADLTGSNLTASKLRDCMLVETKFINCVLQEADFSAAWLNETNFYGADLSRAQFCGAEGYRTVWVKANLREADLREIHIVKGDFTKTDLTGANLSNGIFTDTNFQGAILEEVNVENADLSGCDLRGAKLKGVRLKGAYLKRTRFSKQDVELLELDATQKKMILIEEG